MASQVSNKCKTQTEFRDCIVNPNFITSMRANRGQLLNAFIKEEANIVKEFEIPTSYVTINRIRLLIYYTFWYSRLAYGNPGFEMVDTTPFVRDIQSAFSSNPLYATRIDFPIPPFYIVPYPHGNYALTGIPRQALAVFYGDVAYVVNFIANTRPSKERWSDGTSTIVEMEKPYLGKYTAVTQFVDGFNSMRNVYSVFRGREEFKKRINNRFHSNVYNLMYLERIFSYLLFPKGFYSSNHQKRSDNLLYATHDELEHNLEINNYPVNNKLVSVHPGIREYISLHRGADFIVLFPTLVFRNPTSDEITGFHANVLFYNKSTNTVEVFDPHISYERLIAEFQQAYKELAITLFGTSKIEFHKRINLQELQEDEYGATVTECGNCASWALWYAETRLRHSKKSVSEFVGWLHEYEIAPRMSLPHPSGTKGEVWHSRLGRYFTDLAKNYVDHIHNTYNIVAATTSENIKNAIKNNVDTSLSSPSDEKLTWFEAADNTYPTGYVRPSLSSRPPSGVPPPMTTQKGTVIRD